MAFIASAAAIYALGVLPNQEVDENSRSLVLWILGGSWVLSMAHILFLICFVSDGPDGGNQEDKESPELVSK
ncbi:hypothetical protein [Pseudarthrobacter sp. LT1]|uniref:hypothetical protein n=1 Tax=Pseudarthrobacter sp. LT1 TaxID=3111450 RepID=UPI002D799B15|nr:hypothetical protein [Pseudarthrobacter sp. LT1]WRT15610.1 hypothetical protein VIK36_09090 [Pseudarthrobacter sp. LT1]